MMRSRFPALAVALVLAGCGDDPDTPAPASLSVDPASVSLRVGESASVSASLRTAGARLAGGELRWSSSDPAHATVSGDGEHATITAVAAGSAIITASTHANDSELSAEVAVTVSPASLVEIAIAPAVPTLPAGTTQTLAVIATYSDASTADITASATWTSEAPAIASFAGNVLTGVAKGDTTVTARYLDKLSSTHVFVTDAVLRSIEVTPAVAGAPVGGTQQFTATGTYSNATSRDLTAEVSWSSSNPALATISTAAGTAGLATTVATGTVTISAARAGVTGTATLTVEPAALVAITVLPDAPDLAVTTDQPFTAIGTFSDRSTLDITPTVAWSSSDPAVATIDAGGIASALALGTTRITAQRGAIAGSTDARVVLPAVGDWIPAAGFAGRPCHDGVKFSMASDLVYVCTTATGLVRGSVAADASISFAPADLGTADPTSLRGLSLTVHPTNDVAVMYTTVPSASANNWYRIAPNTPSFTASALLDSASAGRFLYAGRFQPGLGNVLGTWDPGSAGPPQAIVLTGQNAPLTPHAVATATGVVRAITGSAASNLYVAVLGETPGGAPATGGVFHSTDAGQTWAEADTGIAAADRDQVISIVSDPAAPATLFAGVRGGARIYRSLDGGASWAPSAAGIPSRARVELVYLSPQDPQQVFAATDRGLYKSTDAGATWRLAGFLGRAVTGIAQSSAAPSLILVAVDDEVGLYRAP